jgi:hypothetical protein
VRLRAESFADHYSQARQFYRSQTGTEQRHIAMALTFELSKVETLAIRERMVAHLLNIDDALAATVAEKLGIADMPAPRRRRRSAARRPRAVAGAFDPAERSRELQGSEARCARRRGRRSRRA